MVFKTFSAKEITSVIKLLKTKNSQGCDEISTKLLKISTAYICSPLTSIMSGIFPDHLRFSIIKLIYKKGDRMNPANYRRILLMTSFSKVFEKTLYVRLTGYFCSNKLLVGNQFGCRKCEATEDAIFKLISEFLNALNNKTMAGIIFCDLEKALDSVNQNLLLSKLSYYGISGKGKLLLESFLQNKYQRFQIISSYINSNRVSKWTKIKYGVPQG